MRTQVPHGHGFTESQTLKAVMCVVGEAGVGPQLCKVPDLKGCDACCRRSWCGAEWGAGRSEEDSRDDSDTRACLTAEPRNVIP